MSDPTAGGWIPFIDPLPIAGAIWWALSLPLAIGISMVHKAWRMPTTDGYLRQVALMTIQILLAMIGLALALAILVQVVVPLLPA